MCLVQGVSAASAPPPLPLAMTFQEKLEMRIFMRKSLEFLMLAPNLDFGG